MSRRNRLRKKTSVRDQWRAEVEAALRTIDWVDRLPDEHLKPIVSRFTGELLIAIYFVREGEYPEWWNG